MLSAALIAAPWKTPESMLGAALHQEEVEGDLKGAIGSYQKVLAAPGVNRKTAAEALLHMGQCYEKLGSAESRKAYERIVREYADQKDAVTTARAKLGGSVHNAGMITRQVWTGPKVDGYDGTVSADGKYLSFTDWETGDLAIHDLSTGTNRRLTSKGSWLDSNEFAEESAIAPDASQVVYAWFNGKGRYELRTIKLSPVSGAPPRILYDNEDIDWIAPSEWSPSGKLIAVNIMRKDRTVQIGLVDSGSGALRVLKSGEWSGAGKLAFSPDGRFLAFDRPASEDSEQRDVFVLAVDGSREVPAVVHTAMDAVVGWSPDGKKLLFTSNRTGSTGIWALPMEDGKPHGAAEPIKSDVGRLQPLGVTRSGALFFGVRTGGPDIYVASLDSNSGKLLSPPHPATDQFMGSNRQPDWSPDGKYIAYTTLGPGGRSNILTIQSIDTGKVRQFHPRLSYFQWPRWSPNGQTFLVSGTDLKGRSGIYRIDAHSGNADLVVVTRDESLSRLPQWAPDGKHIYYGRRAGDGGNPQAEMVLVERDLASGNERELLRSKEIDARTVSVSPDGRQIAYGIIDRDKGYSALMLVPAAGGDARELLRVPGQTGGGFVTWSSDGKSLIVTGAREVWMLSVADGRMQKSEDFGLSDIRGLRVQPGGNKLVFFRPTANSAEVWALENFLPVLKASK